MAKLGIQLYTVRDSLEKDYFGTVFKMKELGYDGVEFPGGVMQRVEPEELAQKLAEADLELAGLMFGYAELSEKLEEIIAYCKACGCTTALCPMMPNRFAESAEGIQEVAQALNGWGKRMAECGIQLLYHVHGNEFSDFEGICGFDLFMDALDTRYVQLEIDVYWVEYGKVNAVAFMEKYGHLSPSIHFKDYISGERMIDTEVGCGCVDMLSVAKIGLKNQAKWFIVEQEEFDKPTEEAAAISYTNLKAITEKAMDESETV